MFLLLVIYKIIGHWPRICTDGSVGVLAWWAGALPRVVWMLVLCVYVYICVDIYAYVYLCICICLCTYTHVHVCIDVFTQAPGFTARFGGALFARMGANQDARRSFKVSTDPSSSHRVPLEYASLAQPPDSGLRRGTGVP